VRLWCLDIRLHRELVKEIRKLQTQAQSEDNQLVLKLICMQLDLFMPDYRRLDDLLLKEKIARLKIKLNKSRTPMQLMATKIK
jgi:hypothetical protein